MNGSVAIPDFVKYLKENDLVVAPRESVDAQWRNQLKTHTVLLAKKALTPGEIAKGNFWGIKSRQQVLKLMRALSAKDELIVVASNGKTTHKLLTSAVLRIAKTRYTYAAL